VATLTRILTGFTLAENVHDCLPITTTVADCKGDNQAVREFLGTSRLQETSEVCVPALGSIPETTRRYIDLCSGKNAPASFSWLSEKRIRPVRRRLLNAIR
jgi:hypothetical protein